MPIRTAMLPIVFVLAACGSGVSVDEDASTPDASGTDAGAAFDAGQRQDSGPRSDAGARDGGPPVDAGPHIRIVAANLTSGNNQSYDPGEGIRIMAALEADLILIQEFNYLGNTETDLRQMVDRVMSSSAAYHRGATGSIPNGVISRWPIIEAGTWDDPEVGNRGFTWARIDIPGVRDLWSVSIHLLTANATTRNREATQLVVEVQNNVPEADYLVIGGDLNTGSRSEITLMTLSAVVTSTHTPTDGEGNDNTNGPRSRPYDWVLPDADLVGLHRPVYIGTQKFEEGLVFDSRVYVPLADLPGVAFGDSDAPQMQHMAVVRDFRLPSGP